MNNFKRTIKTPKVTFNRIGQIFFTIKEITKIAYRISPRLLVLSFFLNAIWGFLAVPGFYIQKLILDKLVNSIGATDIRPVLISTGILMVIALMFSLLRNFLSGYNRFLRRSLSRYMEAELSIMVGSKLSTLDMATIDDPKFQDRFNKIEKESGRRAWGLMFPLTDIPNYLVGFISSLGVILLLNPLIAIGVFVFSIPQIFIDTKYIRREYELYTRQSPLRRLWNWLDMYLFRNSNIMELKLLEIAPYLAKRLKETVNVVLDQSLSLSKKRELSRLWSLIPLTLFELGVSMLLIFWVIVQKITVGSFQLYISSLRSAEQNLTSLVSSLMEIYENYIYVNDLHWFLGLEPKLEIGGGEKFKGDEELSIRFEDVWFKYTKKHPWMLRNVNFEIKPGERIALVGENGAGKTTLIKLITRFYDPQKGGVYIDGKKLTDFDVFDWRKKFTVLFQKFETYPFTVRESIGFGDIERVENLKEIKKAAKDTGISDYIESLPLKYENPLTPRFEKGIDLSAGQWQKIGVARVLFKKSAKVVILDEPTSNVDPEAEEKIFKELTKLARDKILIFVTQRFSTVRVADRIFVMHKGKIIEKGTHRELMKKKGKYERMFTIQAQAYLENNS